MNIPDGALVLEIGSGNNPQPRSDILCDRFIHSNHDRAGAFKIHIDRPMIVADGMRLPFADHTFDYVIASHIFEHMDDPAGFAREIERVGRGGYIEVPSALSERVFGWKFHHWHCLLRDGVLAFIPKQEGEQHGGFFHTFLARNTWFRRFFEQHEAQWYTRLEWQDRIPIRIASKPMRQEDMEVLDTTAWDLLAQAKKEGISDAFFALRFFLRRAKRKILKEMRLLVWQAAVLTMERTIISSLVKRCVCPLCHGILAIQDKKLVCEKCHTDYLFDGVIPVLLTPEERKNKY